MNQKLIDTLKASGKSTEVFTSPDGSEVLLLPYGGRVLGLFARGSNQNFYWTHTALESVESARAFYQSDVWQNSGGDRTWLAPEADIFFPNFPRLDPYFQPRQLDPGNYQVSSENGRLRLVNRLTIRLSRTGKEVELEMAKSVAPAANPLRYERGLNLAGLEYAGYTQYTSLALVGANKEGCVGLWNLVQMPHGGDLLVPTYAQTKPRLIMGSIPPEDLICGDHLIRYKMRQKGEHKISIRAAAAGNRVGYIYQSGDTWAVIIRNFVVNPSGEYVDVPWTETDDFGYSTQACNVHSHLGQFSELEYHIPAIGPGTGQTRCDDAAQVWAFRGPKEAIFTVARSLLSPEA